MRKEKIIILIRVPTDSQFAYPDLPENERASVFFPRPSTFEDRPVLVFKILSLANPFPDGHFHVKNDHLIQFHINDIFITFVTLGWISDLINFSSIFKLNFIKLNM